MNIGKLNKRISIIEQSTNQNSYGEVEDSWESILEVWANVKPLQGRELYLAKQTNAELTSKVTIRYTTSVSPDNRIKYGNRIFEIISPPINVNEENRFLELLCKELI